MFPKNTNLSNKKDDMLIITSPFYQEVVNIRKLQINWTVYSSTGTIKSEDCRLISCIDKAGDKNRKKLIEENKRMLPRTLLKFLDSGSKETIKYVLVMIDDMLQEDPKLTNMFRDYSLVPTDQNYGVFFTILSSHDNFIQNMTARVISKIACWSSELMDKADLRYYLECIKHQLRNPNNTEIEITIRCLQIMLRIDEYRAAFIYVDGLSEILSTLTGNVSFQIQYQLIFCIWLLSYNSRLAEKMNRFSVVPILTDILGDNVKEKVVRIILAVFRNLIEQSKDASAVRNHCNTMVQSQLLKQIRLMENRKFEDEDLLDDIKFLTNKLVVSFQALSSFDEYVNEVTSGRLEWSPVHRSTQFWKDNASRLNEKNYELIRILIHVLDTKRAPTVLSVACYDIGEYVRHYPRGKIIIENLGGKQLLLQLLTNDDANVRYEALIAVQKLLFHNWEYLERQSETETPAAKAQAKEK